MTDWLNELLATHSALQTVVVLSIICSVGLALGKVRVGGVSLGVAFVFFIGILAGHLGLSIDVQTLDYAETFGLVVFVYMLGLHVGPHFFSSLRHEGMELNLWSFAVIALGTVMAVALTGVTDVSLPDMVGVLCGATTNTPALGAAQQALAHLGLPTGSAALATAVTYPLGVLGVILAMMLIRRLFVKPADLELRSQDADDQTYVGQFVVVNPALADKSVAEISQMSHLKFIISRIWRGQQVLVPQADTLLRLYDNVLVVTKKDDVGAMEILFGEKTETDWNGEKIDWNHIDAKVESRTLVLSRKVLNGKRLGHLQLRHTYGVNVSRITRGDIKLLATDDLRLQYGDRLTVVGEPRSLDNVEKFLGNGLAARHGESRPTGYCRRPHRHGHHCRLAGSPPPLHQLHHALGLAHAAQARSVALSGLPRTRCRPRLLPDRHGSRRFAVDRAGLRAHRGARAHHRHHRPAHTPL